LQSHETYLRDNTKEAKFNKFELELFK